MKLKAHMWVGCAVAIAAGLGSRAGLGAQDGGDTLAAIQKQTAQIQTLSAEFASVKHVSFLSSPILTRGRLLFIKPGRVCWEITAPFKAAVVYDGQSAVRYLPGAQGQWVRQNQGADPVLAETMRQLQMWLSGQAFAAQEAYGITVAPGPPVRVQLVPKHPGLRRFISGLELTFGQNLDVVQTLALTEGSGDITRISFSKIAVNAPLPKNEWFTSHDAQP